jgi:hypothetical protein
VVWRNGHDDNHSPRTKISARSRGAGLSLLANDGARVVRTTIFYPKGRFAFTRATSVSWTRAALPSRRLRFALFVDSRWRREERDLKTFPRAVILKRFATDLRVLLRAMGFGIRPGS